MVSLQIVIVVKMLIPLMDSNGMTWTNSESCQHDTTPILITTIQGRIARFPNSIPARDGAAAPRFICLSDNDMEKFVIQFQRGWSGPRSLWSSWAWFGAMQSRPWLQEWPPGIYALLRCRTHLYRYLRGTYFSPCCLSTGGTRNNWKLRLGFGLGWIGAKFEKCDEGGSKSRADAADIFIGRQKDEGW